MNIWSDTADFLCGKFEKSKIPEFKEGEKKRIFGNILEGGILEFASKIVFRTVPQKHFGFFFCNLLNKNVQNLFYNKVADYYKKRWVTIGKL